MEFWSEEGREDLLVEKRDLGVESAVMVYMSCVTDTLSANDWMRVLDWAAVMLYMTRVFQAGAGKCGQCGEMSVLCSVVMTSGCERQVRGSIENMVK